MKKSEAKTIIESLSNPSKMPCKGYSLPASKCKTGSKLSKQKNTVCSQCYAQKGCYVFGNVQAALNKRLESIQNKKWTEAMAKMLENDLYFRWHDSGDIQNIEHLIKIFNVCELTPDTKHWLPTKEKAIVRAAIRKGHKIPDNLIIRYSSPMIDQEPQIIDSSVHTSNSITHPKHAHGVICKAFDNDGECGSCRACWNKENSNISYFMH